MQRLKIVEDMQGEGSGCQNSKLMYWWEYSTACEMVHGANNSEPCSLQTGSGMQVLGTELFRLENPLRSSHRHGTLHWERYEAMCLEWKPQQWSQCTPHFMVQWSMEQNSAEICLEGSSFTSKLQEWGNSNVQPMTEERDGVSLSCEKRWPVHRQGTCASSQSVWFHCVSIPWNHISVSHQSDAWMTPVLGCTVKSWHKPRVFSTLALPMVLLGNLQTAIF